MLQKLQIEMAVILFIPTIVKAINNAEVCQLLIIEHNLMYYLGGDCCLALKSLSFLVKTEETGQMLILIILLGILIQVKFMKSTLEKKIFLI